MSDELPHQIPGPHAQARGRVELREGQRLDLAHLLQVVLGAADGDALVWGVGGLFGVGLNGAGGH